MNEQKKKKKKIKYVFRIHRDDPPRVNFSTDLIKN